MSSLWYKALLIPVNLSPLPVLGADKLVEVIDDWQDVIQLLLELLPLKFEGLKLIRKLLSRRVN